MAFGYGYSYGYAGGAQKALGGFSPPALTLQDLTLSSDAIVEGGAPGTAVGSFVGKTAGSTIALTDDAGGRFAVAGNQLIAGLVATDYETAVSHDITWTETLEGAVNSPHAGGATVHVINVADGPTLGALSLSSSTFTVGLASSGTINGATTGSTITASGLPSGLTINGAARTWTWSGEGDAGTGDLMLTETLADSPNSPRDGVIGWTVEAASSGPELVTPVGLAATGANPVVGEVLIPTPAVWSEEPTGRAYAWYRGEELVSTAGTYTVDEDDAASATRDALTVKETAVFAGGPLESTSAALSMARRTWPSLAYNIGRLTRAGYGSVSFASPTLGCLGTGATAPSTWTIGTATTGTDAHWNKTVGAGLTPEPTSTGASAGLADGTYIFPVTATFADGLEEEITLTITSIADVITIGDTDGFSSGTNIATGHVPNASLAGKTLEFATGVNWANLRVILNALQPAAAAIVRDADPNRPSNAASWEFRDCYNLTINDLTVTGLYASQNGHFMLGRGTGATGCRNLTFNRPKVVGAFANTASDASAGFRYQNCENITINDFEASWVQNGVKQDPLYNSTNIVFNRPVIRNFTDNAFIIGGDNTSARSDVTINDPIAIAAWRYPDSNTHLDFLQVHGAARATTVKVRRFVAIHGAGDAQEQSFHSGIDGDGIIPDPALFNTFDIDGWLYVGRTWTGFGLGTSVDTTISHFTVWKTDSGPVSTASGQNDDYVDGGPRVSVDAAANFGGMNVISKGIVFDKLLMQNSANAVYFDTTDSMFFYNGTRTAPPVDTGFAVSDPKAVIDALDYGDDVATADIVAAVKAALTPAVSGAYDLGSGEWAGALKPDGSWASA